jgi:hypothetical protein
MGVGLIGLVSLSDNQPKVLATATTKSLTINNTNSPYISSDVLDYTANYNKQNTYPVKTVGGYSFQSAMLISSYYSSGYTLGGGYIFKSAVKDGEADGMITIGLNNIKSVTLNVVTNVAAQNIDYCSMTLYDADLVDRETVQDGSFYGEKTFTPTKIDNDGNAYIPRWAFISFSKNWSKPTTSNFIALVSCSLSWEC